MDWLSLVTFFPMIGVLLLMLVPSSQHHTIKLVSLLVAIATMLVSFYIGYFFDPIASGMQFEIDLP